MLEVLSENSKTLIEVIVTLLGVILTAFVTYIISKRESKIEAVTVNREKWLQSFREDISHICLAINLIKSKKQVISISNLTSAEQDILYKGEASKFKLMSRLNITNPANNKEENLLRVILSKLNLVPGLIDISYVKNLDMTSLMQLVNIILEKEWKKIKRES